MKKLRISVVFGTRPEAIKLAPVILELQKRGGISCHVCVTAQHREMLDQILETFAITPDVDLDIMSPDQALGRLTARLVERLDTYMAEYNPDLVLVQGDTTTTFCAALAAFYHQIPVGHVEAGLRTGDLYSPWPEEANRIITSRLSAVHFAPTPTNRTNLIREGIPAERIVVTGNTVIDALLLAAQKVEQYPPPVPALSDCTLWKQPHSSMVLITGHRRENFGSGMESICRAIAALAARFPETHFVYPVHLNPHVQQPVRSLLDSARYPNIHLVDPLPYLPFVALMKRATLILTDSGGIQEEAPSLGKPVLVMRNTTERPEAVAAGTAILVGTDTDTIVRETERLLTDRSAYERMAGIRNPYGDGRAAERIVDHCLEIWGR